MIFRMFELRKFTNQNKLSLSYKDQFFFGSMLDFEK